MNMFDGLCKLRLLDRNSSSAAWGILSMESSNSGVLQPNGQIISKNILFIFQYIVYGNPSHNSDSGQLTQYKNSEFNINNNI